MLRHKNGTPATRPKQHGLRVIIADDHAFLRNSVVQLLETQRVQVVGQAVTGDAAVLLAKELSPDVVIMDARIPGGMDGIMAMRELRDSVPRCRVIGLSMDHDQHTEARMRAAGVAAYVRRSDPLQVLLDAVLSGRPRGRRSMDNAAKPLRTARIRNARG